MRKPVCESHDQTPFQQRLRELSRCRCVWEALGYEHL